MDSDEVVVHEHLHEVPAWLAWLPLGLGAGVLIWLAWDVWHDRGLELRFLRNQNAVLQELLDEKVEDAAKQPNDENVETDRNVTDA